MTREELSKRIYEVSNLQGEFRLRSGRVSNEYFDKYLFEAQPEILRAIAEAMSQIVPSATDALAGLEMGGIPLATMLSQVTGIPAVFVRKKQKEYGTCKLAEGGEVRGRRLVVVEDVVTSGGQILESVEQLLTLGATVTDILCVIDRESGGKQNLAARGLTLRPLFLMSELKEAANKHIHAPPLSRRA